MMGRFTIVALMVATITMRIERVATTTTTGSSTTTSVTSTTISSTTTSSVTGTTVSSTTTSQTSTTVSSTTTTVTTTSTTTRCHENYKAPISSTTCPDDEFACADGRQCIKARWACDDEPDCKDESDEERFMCECESTTSTSTSTSTSTTAPTTTTTTTIFDPGNVDCVEEEDECTVACQRFSDRNYAVRVLPVKLGRVCSGPSDCQPGEGACPSTTATTSVTTTTVSSTTNTATSTSTPTSTTSVTSPTISSRTNTATSTSTPTSVSTNPGTPVAPDWADATTPTPNTIATPALDPSSLSTRTTNVTNTTTTTSVDTSTSIRIALRGGTIAAIVGVVLLTAAAICIFVYIRKHKTMAGPARQRDGDAGEIELGELRRNTMEMQANPLAALRRAKARADAIQATQGRATRRSKPNLKPANTIVNAMYTAAVDTAQPTAGLGSDSSSSSSSNPHQRKNTTANGGGADAANPPKPAAPEIGDPAKGVTTGQPVACAYMSKTNGPCNASVSVDAESADSHQFCKSHSCRWPECSHSKSSNDTFCGVHSKHSTASAAPLPMPAMELAEYVNIDEINCMAYLDNFAGGTKEDIYGEMVAFGQMQTSGALYMNVNKSNPVSLDGIVEYATPIDEPVEYATPIDEPVEYAIPDAGAGSNATNHYEVEVDSALYAKAAILERKAVTHDLYIKNMEKQNAALKWKRLAKITRAMAAHQGKYDALFKKWAGTPWVDDLDFQHKIVVRNSAAELVSQRNPWGDAGRKGQAGVEVTSKTYMLKLLEVYKQQGDSSPVPTIAAACRQIAEKLGDGAVRFKLGKIKKQARIFEKVLTNDGRFDLIRDYARALFIVADVAAFPRLLQHLLVDDAFTVVRAKNRLSKSWDSRESAGYRDYQVLVQTNEGWIMEIQLIPKAMYKLKTKLGHADYVQYRFIIEAGRRARAAAAGASASSSSGYFRVDESGV